MSDANDIRAYVAETYIAPARKNRMSRVSFVSQDIHEAPRFKGRPLAACGAIDTIIFEQGNRVRCIERARTKKGATIRWTFALDYTTAPTAPRLFLPEVHPLIPVKAVMSG